MPIRLANYPAIQQPRKINEVRDPASETLEPEDILEVKIENECEGSNNAWEAVQVEGITAVKIENDCEVNDTERQTGEVENTSNVNIATVCEGREIDTNDTSTVKKRCDSEVSDASTVKIEYDCEVNESNIGDVSTVKIEYDCEVSESNIGDVSTVKIEYDCEVSESNIEWQTEQPEDTSKCENREEECEPLPMPALPMPGGKPPFTYPQLVSQALYCSPDKKCTLKEIYSFIAAQYPYYRADDKVWQVRSISYFKNRLVA